MKIAFHLYFMTMRGTEVATYDFAHFNETLLGNESIIVYSQTSRGEINPNVLKKFESRFPVAKFEGDIFSPEVANALSKNLKDIGVDAIYNHEVFSSAHWLCPDLHNIIHATFPWCSQRGDTFAFTSEWLARPSAGCNVPLMIHQPNIDEDMRSILKLPEDTVVIGRYGGRGTFDLPFAHEAIKHVVTHNRNITFLFMNTDKFMEDHPQVIHLPPTENPEMKVAFINTCDAMLHAGSLGESFGLAVGEFSMRNKPVMTWRFGKNKAHIEHLGHKGFYYEGRNDLINLLENFPRKPEGDWDAFSERFNPETVMKQFKDTLLP